jgi:hypothetical protein
MNLIDIDSLELARYSVIEVEVDLGIQIIEDTSLNPDTSKNAGYVKVMIMLKGPPRTLIATAIMHHLELDNLVATLEEE